MPSPRYRRCAPSSRTALAARIAGLLALFATPGAARAAGDALTEGWRLWREGEVDAAVEAWEDDTDRDDWLLRRYNAGVALLEAGRLEDAIPRFEEAEAQGEDELRRRAASNLALCHFRTGRALLEKKPEDEAEDANGDPASPGSPGGAGASGKDGPGADLRARRERLVAAADALRKAVEFYREVEPSDDRSRRDLGVAKTALAVALDRIAQVEDELRRLEEERALEDPPALLRRLLGEESHHRNLARRLADAPASRRRLASRRLVEAEAGTRRLTEMLRHKLEQDAAEARQAEEKAEDGSVPDDPASLPLEEKIALARRQLEQALDAGATQPGAKQAVRQQLEQLDRLEQALPDLPAEEREKIDAALAQQLSRLAAAGPQAGDAERLEGAAEALRRAVEAQRDAEVALGKRKPGDAVPHHQSAVQAMREARARLPLDLRRLVADALAKQRPAAAQLRTIAGERGAVEPGDPGDGEATGDTGDASEPDPARDTAQPAAGPAGGEADAGGTGELAEGDGRDGASWSEDARAFGDLVLRTLRDRVLEPVARTLRPQPDRSAQLDAIGWAEDDVAWAANVLAEGTIPDEALRPPQAGQPPGSPGAPRPEPPGAAPGGEDLDALRAGIREAAATARDKARAARDAVEGDELATAVPAAEAALAALERIDELLPDAPKTPEQRLAELVEEERAALEAAGGLPDLEPEPRDEGAAELARSQRDAGGRAEDIAGELEGRQGNPRAGAAAEKVREGAGRVFASAEAVERALWADTESAIEEGIASFEEALALLQGKGQRENQQRRQPRQQPGGDEDRKGQDDSRRRTARQLTAHQARQRQQEMDEERREAERQLYRGSSGVTVEKDW